VRFWDTSAIIPLLVEEIQSQRSDDLIELDPAIVVWWGTPVECGSALARQLREGALDMTAHTAATARLRQVGLRWVEVPPTDDVRNQALRILRMHPLRAADALHLAAALIASDFRPDQLEFVSYDARLSNAAALEGFTVLGES
jgi:predicted nucleic acid-binding protein